MSSRSRSLAFEQLEDRTLCDAGLGRDLTAADIRWDGTPLSTDHTEQILGPDPARSTFAFDIASADGSRIARGFHNGDIQIVDATTGAVLHDIAGDGRYVAEIELSPDGKYLAAGLGAPLVRVFETENYTHVRTINTRGFTYPLAFIGEEMFSSTWDNKPVTVANLRTGAVREIGGGTNVLDMVTTIGDRLYGMDQTKNILKEIDPSNGAVLRSVQMPGSGIPFGHDATQTIAIGSSNGVQLFDADLQQIAAFDPGIGFIDHIGFDETGTKITARSVSSVAYLNRSDATGTVTLTEEGKFSMTRAGRYENGLPMTKDGTVAFLKSESGIVAKRTPWALPQPPVLTPTAPVIDQAITQVTQELQQRLAMPEELTTLIAESVRMAENDTAWRAPAAAEATITGLTTGHHLNLRGADGMARGVQAQVLAATGTTVRAHIFRGNDKVTEVLIGTDGAFAYENDEGITDVLFIPTTKSNVTIGGMQVSVMPDMAQTATNALTAFTSREYGLAAAPVVPIPNNVKYVAESLNFYGKRTISGESRIYIVRDPTKYTLLRGLATGPWGGKISMIGTIRKDGQNQWGKEYGSTSGFPTEYAQWIDANTVLIAAGAPATISMIVGGYGSKGTVSVTEGDSPEAVLPPTVMSTATVQLSLMKLSAQFKTEGVFPGLTEIQESSSPVFASPGHQVNALYQIHNEAMGGGTLTFDVYAGWNGEDPTLGQLQERFTFDLGGGETKSISVNVTAPARPDTATSDRPIISYVLRFADGTSEGGSKLGKEPKGEERTVTASKEGGVTIAWKSRTYSAQEQLRMAELTKDALDALLSSPNKKLEIIRNVLGDEHILDLLAQNAAAIAAIISTVEDPAEAVKLAVETSEALLDSGTNYELATAVDDPAYQAIYQGQTYKFVHDDLHVISSEEKSWTLEGGTIIHSVKFELEQDSMVNIWLDDVNGLDLKILKNGQPLHASPNKGYLSGKSISARMDAGAYEIQSTRLPDLDFNLTPGPIGADLHLTVTPFHSGFIEGTISIDSSPQTMPVSMRMAEFDPITKQRLEISKNKLQTNLPVWIVIHGRSDNEGSDAMEELTKSMQTDGMQIVTIDWSQAAGANFPSAVGLQSSQWIQPVGKWITNQLLSLGFTSNNINVAGHSFGALIGYEVSKNLPQGLNALVALDPAKNSDMLGGAYDLNQVNFAAHSITSYAFHSSFYGDRGLALTADSTFDILAPENYEGAALSIAQQQALLHQYYFTALNLEIIDETVLDPIREHGFAVTLFSSLLKQGGAGSVASRFTLGALTSQSPSFLERSNQSEGAFFVQPTMSTFTKGENAGEDWYKAEIYEFFGKDAAGNDIQ